ncbi:MAG: IPT/TIG domain-containing protein [Deltaproteobacteria bacterium]|nr:IPT/TIG domain-containing protein [Deltaproteobacteria bacterium]
MSLNACACNDPFWFNQLNYPQVDSIDPANGPTKGGTQVTIQGENFIDNTKIFFDEESKPCLDIEIVSQTQIKCITPVHDAGEATVKATHVTTGTGERTATFTYEPPPEYKLKPGDEVGMGKTNITFCPSSTCSGNETEVAWMSSWFILTPEENGNEDPVYISETTGQWEVKARYYHKVTNIKDAQGPPSSLFSNSWLAAFGPWDQPEDSVDDGVGTFTTSEPPIPTGSSSYPFFDMANWDAADAKFTEYVKAIDPEANIKNQQASRRLEAWYVDSEDNKEHHVWIIFHSVGIVCSVDEEMIDAPASPLREQGDFTAAPYITPKANASFAYVTRASGPLAGQKQTCSCAFDTGCE